MSGCVRKSKNSNIRSGVFDKGGLTTKNPKITKIREEPG
jgi:hypothetical protein